MNRNIILTFFIMFIVSLPSYGQDTVRLDRKPEVIIKSWYPEFKEFPDLKIGESKILFTIIPDFMNTSIRDNDINLITRNDSVQIEETEKKNQYLITVKPTDSSSVEIELWFELRNKTILTNQEGKWTDIRTIYRVEGNRILIDSINLKINK